MIGCFVCISIFLQIYVKFNRLVVSCVKKTVRNTFVTIIRCNNTINFAIMIKYPSTKYNKTIKEYHTPQLSTSTGLLAV